MALIDKIGRELQARFGYTEIDTFLHEFNILPPTNVSANSKWVYSKAALHGVATEVVIKIADELDIEVPSNGISSSTQPRNWKETKEFKLFISHISLEKAKATRLKECLAPYGISGFVAHEDIHPTLEWQSEIERALHHMDALVAIHTEGFSKSFWTQQEIGFAVGKGKKIISLRIGEDPTGFISKRQALPRKNKRAEEIAKDIDQLLSEDDMTASRLNDAKLSLGISLLRNNDEIPF